MFSKILIVLCYLTFFDKSQAEMRVDPLVDTKVGLIRGLRAEDGDYSMFLGIPYAKVNEANPFGPSVPYDNFDEIFEAYDDSAICPQIEEFNNTIVGSVDCLQLNIYVPAIANAKNPLPVLVWIYGGGFQIGFAGRYLYGPKYLVRHDIIVITINYRVGPYGFMCLDNPEVPGNQGLKDQLLALRWIKENINSFGGNPHKITLMGESAGGKSVDYHLIFSQEKLFNNVILQSGTSLVPLGFTEPGSTRTLTLAAKLGLETDNVDEALSFLRSANTNLVIAAAAHMENFLPCIENTFDNVEKFMLDYSVNLNIPKAKNISILIGHNNDEKIPEHVNKDSDYFENLDIFYDKLKNAFSFNSSELNNVVNNFRHFYIGDEKLTEEEKFNIINFDSDFTYIHPTQRSIKKYVENGADKIFYYVFSYNGNRNFVKKRLNITAGGAGHADEIGYLFDISYMKETLSPEDQLVIDKITLLWANFVKYSNPTPDASELLPVNWKSVEKEILYYLEINSELTLKKRPFNKRMAFWDLFYEYYYMFQKGYRNKDN